MKEKLFASIQEAFCKKTERTFGVRQAKWSILCRPSKFMSQDSTENIISCTIILHNMCVKERKSLGAGIILEKGEDSEVVVIGGGVTAMWCSLVRLHNTTDVQPSVKSLSARCEGKAYMENESDHVTTKKFLVSHLWARYRER